MPLMKSRYDGRCKGGCSKRFKAGDEIFWSRSTGSICLSCHAGGILEGTEKRSTGSKASGKGNSSGKTESRVSSNLKLPGTTTRNGRHSYFTIDWSLLKSVVKEALEEKSVSICKISYNSSRILQHCRGDSWRGYTTEQLKRWVTKGYDAEGIRGLGDFDPPLREKRRYRYCEDGDEILVDRALSGADDYMAEWTSRENIPGVAIEAEVMFAASVSAETVNAYNVFICRSILTLESAGIDAEVTLKFSSDEMGDGDRLFYHAIVKVKKENEATDFRSFSAMLSPATLRTFGFTALQLHAEANGRSGSSSVGRGNRSASEWSIVWNPERRVLEFNCPYSQTGRFPEDHMQAQLRNALHAMKTQS